LAVQNNEVYAVNAGTYYSEPGPTRLQVIPKIDNSFTQYEYNSKFESPITCSIIIELT